MGCGLCIKLLLNSGRREKFFSGRAYRTHYEQAQRKCRGLNQWCINTLSLPQELVTVHSIATVARNFPSTGGKKFPWSF